MNKQHIAALAHKPFFFVLPKEYIFIISHMRSHSSLLSHVLGSNREIAGYSESHFSYKDSKSLLKLKYYIYKSCEGNVDCHYILDKILADHPISDKFLLSDKFKFLFLLRKPEKTLKSIINMVKKQKKLLQYANEHEALNYYINRLHMMTSLAQRARNTAFLESEKIINNSDDVLINITKWLNLKNPLKREYQIFKETGVSGRGDPVGLIKQGMIHQKKNNYENIILSKDVQKKADSEYKTAINNFLKSIKIII